MRMDGRALQTPAGRVTWMLWALTLGSFLTTSSGATRSPFLLDMARDLDTDLMAVANLMAAMSVTWGIASLVAGTASDRFGRKAILTGAIVLVGGAMGGIGLAGLVRGRGALGAGRRDRRRQLHGDRLRHRLGSRPAQPAGLCARLGHDRPVASRWCSACRWRR